MPRNSTRPTATKRNVLKTVGVTSLLSTGFGEAVATRGSTRETTRDGNRSQRRSDRQTATPIEHVVVIFQENVSFDHYFGTYPHAKNPDGVPQFHAKPDTPTVNGLTDALLNDNPNKYNPRRLSRDHAVTADMDHDYEAEQKAFDHGLMDEFVEHTEGGTWSDVQYDAPGLVMDYYDGNTVTAMWNYAQHFAMSDNSFGTVTGPSTPGHINLVSGQTHGGYWVDKSGTKISSPSAGMNEGTLAAVNSNGVGTVIGDPDPAWDDEGDNPGMAMTGRNVGDLLNENDVSWGWFQGGFRNPQKHQNVANGIKYGDYSAHHAAFQYYESTANPHHRPPASPDEIGHDGQANHQYDLDDFFTALNHGNLPAVSFLKASMYQDGHAGYSDPLDEQHFVVHALNEIQKSAAWESTAVVIAYDDSDGWYDHVMPPTVNPSQTKYDRLTGDGESGSGEPLGGYQARYGYGPRLPLLVVSPYSRVNHVDSALTDQTSVLRFVEDNWDLGRVGDASFDQLAGSLEGMFDFEDHRPDAKRLFLDPETGQPIHGTTRSPHDHTAP